MTEITNSLRQSAASANRPRLPPRALVELYKLPSHALLTPAEVSVVVQITESALAVRRTKGEWPHYLKFGRLVRYRLGDILALPNDGVAR
jgi:hypothetical protein